MKIIVTGGAGFIASHIADEYIKKGHKVVVIDNLWNGFRKNLNPKAKFYKADIRDLAQMEKIFKKERPEVVNHHAAIAQVVLSVRDPIPTLTTNVLGTVNVLTAFGKYGKGPHRKFIYASTGGAMYGNPKKIPVNESAPQEPLSPYALSKQMAEEAVLFYAKTYNFPYFIFRYANVFGPRQNEKGEAGIVAIFMGLLKHNKQPTIFGDGSKTRDYVYVGDVAHANVLALAKGKNVRVNIGTGIEMSDREIFEAIARAAHYAGAPRYAPFRPGEIMHISIDAGRARRLLGWRPTVTLARGIQNVADSMRRS